MSFPSIHSALTSIADYASGFVEGRARSRRHAETVRYLSSLPNYLREDIGLLDDADILDAVECGRLHDAVSHRERHHPLIAAPNCA